MGDGSCEDMNGTDWSSLLPLPGSIGGAESDSFVGYTSDNMSYFNGMSSIFDLPFAWDHGNMVARGPIGSTETTIARNAPLSTAEIRRKDFGQVVGTAPSHTAHFCPAFPMLEDEALQIADAEIFGHISRIPMGAYTQVRSFYISERGHDDGSFPHSRLLHAFAELYFEYFDPYLPLLHPVKVERHDLSWILLIAVAAIGSQYSEVREAPTFTKVFHHLLRQSIQAHVGLHS
jgi:hypothetical protein